MKIHSTALVSAKSELGRDVSIGPFAIIEDDVIIGDGCQIGSNALISAGTRLGEKCRVFHSAVLGSIPQDLKFGGEKTLLEIGARTTIREFATLNRGTKDRLKTVIGSDCLLMAYSHIAHDCILGNHVIIANAVNMAGHVTIEDNVGVGGLCGIHQFVRIGKHAFIGGGLRVHKDVPPFILAMGDPLRYGGLNRVGLMRREFSEEVLVLIKESYRILFQTSLTVKEALKKIEDEIEPIDEIRDLVSFIGGSERGIIR